MTDTTTNTEQNTPPNKSPHWSWTTKLIVGLALVAVAIWLLVQFQTFLGPLITAFVLAYLAHPLAIFLQQKVKIPWRLSVTIVFILIIVIIGGLLTWGGVALVDQIQKMISFINNNIDKLPELVEKWTTQSYHIGPFTIDPIGFDWNQITNEIVGAIQPIIGRIGAFAGSFAAGAASTLSWIVIILLIAYFLLTESKGISHQLLTFKFAGYNRDIEHMNNELSRIWRAFMRGEILIVLISFAIYTVVLGFLGVQFFLGLAIIAAFGQLIPYLGAWITWISFGLVALFQSQIPFGLPAVVYMVIVLAVSIVLNNIIDNIIRTRIMADSLKVHPVLVLIGALIGVRLLGFIGIIIAAPIMASISLILHYVIKKLNDQDPWENLEKQEPAKKTKFIKFVETAWRKFKAWVAKVWKKIFNKSQEKIKQTKNEKTGKLKKKPKQ